VDDDIDIDGDDYVDNAVDVAVYSDDDDADGDDVDRDIVDDDDVNVDGDA